MVKDKPMKPMIIDSKSLFDLAKAMPEWMEEYPHASTALGFAAAKHWNQVRKYTGEPYVFHCLDVMIRLYDHYKQNGLAVPENVLCAAALHDTVEDTNTGFQELAEEFGDDVAGLVFWLTDVCPQHWGNRAMRKRLECDRIAYAPLEAKIIKFHDIASNTESIEQHDPKFAQTYVPEKERILNAIGSISKRSLLLTMDGYSLVK
jgi:(p)ppGpp synthase/HD superfamily hydrolase